MILSHRVSLAQAVCSSVVWAFVSLSTAMASTITVTTTNDLGAGSLRQGVISATPGDTIAFAVSGVITLINGELHIDKDLSIVGPGATNLTISGNFQSRVFNIHSNVTASISGLAIANGHAADGVDGTSSIQGGNGESGGGIYNLGNLRLSDCVVSGNRSGGGGDGNCTFSSTGPGWGCGGAGGGISSYGTLSMTNCSIRNNRAGDGGRILGGLYMAAGHYGGVGGGIYSEGLLTLNRCTINDNSSGNGGMNSVPGGSGAQAGDGGGILNAGGTLKLIACTVSGNAAGIGGAGAIAGGWGGNGGGIWSWKATTITACTIFGNTAGAGGSSGGSSGSRGNGGGICVAGDSLPVVFTSIIAGNKDGGGLPIDVSGMYTPLCPFTSLGHNLIGSTNGTSGFGVSGDIVGNLAAPVDPKLGPLSDYGGPTATHCLLAGSPAMDSGDDAILAAPYSLTTDQRGRLRKVGAHVDIGSIEVSAGPKISVSGDMTFGAVAVGANATRFLQIENTGNLILNISSINYPSGFAGSFSGSITPGSKTNVTVTFTPNSITSYSGTITVLSDSVEGIATVSAVGTGILGTRVIRLEGTLDFGTVTIGNSVYRPLVISNDGNAPLTVTSLDLPEGFTCTFSGTIDPDFRANVEVAFNPTTVANYGGTIRVNCDATSGNSSIDASGAGVNGMQRLVQTVADSGPGSLRDAILYAIPGEQICLPIEGTIILTNGELVITKDLAIVGPGASHLRVDGNHHGRVFKILGGAVLISDLTITNGYGPPSGISEPGTLGGGIYNTGTLTLTDCIISGNSISTGGDGWHADGGNGGGIYNGGTLTLLNCTVSRNTAGPGAAGVMGGDGGDGGNGGGISSDGSLTLIGCTVSANSAGAGSGSGFYGGNGGAGGDGGGVWSRNPAVVIASTVTGNSAGLGGAGGGGPSVPRGTNGPSGNGGGIFASGTNMPVLLNSIIAGNTITNGAVGPDVCGTFESRGHNLLGIGDGGNGLGAAGDLLGSTAFPLNAKLGPLANNGGPTLTHGFLPGSPAIDAGDDAILLAPYSITTDQRGYLRRYGSRVDIGAFEAGPPFVQGITRNGTGFEVRVMDTLGGSNVVQRSLDLLNWTNVGTVFVQPADGLGTFLDSAPPPGKGFYRTVKP